ncbi:MAG TPA: thioredoxin family protein [Myxococcales bacterium]|jgi:tetratricopeptide (TPR) repeat protein|nr:thioredoxin family protein [Myxococcales bacterium]
MLALIVAGAVAANASGIRFIEDDYPAALAQARKEQKPVLVDTWASWCHTCLSMQRFVFPDPGLRPVKDAVVWLSIDGENPKNNAFLDRFPLDAWPTFLVIEPRGERVVGRWIGAASVNDFRGFVQEGARAAGKEKPDAATAELHKGFEARARGDFAAAASAYRKALELTRKDDPARPERLVLLSMALLRSKAPEAARECAQLGLREMDRTGETSIATDFLSAVGGCGERLPSADPLATELRAKSIARLQRLIGGADVPLSVDDRSDAQANLMELLDLSGRHEEAVQVARARAKLLEEAAAGAPDATMASTFDAHRTDTYLYLKEPQKAEELLAGREKEMPGDYNPPARLARVLLEQKKLADAEAAVDRALSKMTRGQRRIGVLGLKARILEKEGKPTAAVVQEQLEVVRELPRTQRSPELEAQLQKKLAEAQKR